MDAAIALREINKPQVVKALIAALDDEQDLVRNHASDSLIEMLHLPFPESDTGGYDISIEMMMEDDKRRNKAKADLLRAITEKQPENQMVRGEEPN
jgi:HEAT repeat protein